MIIQQIFIIIITTILNFLSSESGLEGLSDRQRLPDAATQHPSP